ncbi:MAG: hypothetical protein HN380_05570 [Victivallales bacterium]|jgi:hypothetical protein|nr:hypothetical protein [Victivallales bacterium]
MIHEPSRQIHLDFHTSEHLPAIGSHFRKEQFQEALQLGNVNLINVFGKGHHSWSYYPTRIGNPHPNLTCDLLGGQIEACHEIGVKAPIYFTMGWSAYDAETHPEWCMRNPDGSIVGAWPEDVAPDAPKHIFQWKCLCPSGEYHDLMVAQTEEICQTYPVDGLWYDIYQASRLCYCENCRRGMKDAGLDVERIQDVEHYRAQTIVRHAEDLKRLILGQHPEASVYFNGITTLDRHENARHRIYSINTKNDLEDLPTTWGGYDKFPIRAKFFYKEQKPYVAMSGKFHTSWGEFGGFKTPEAIRYEAASMIAFGASCNFGDQLHPCGEMDLGTYANIGHAYQYVEQIEDYGIGATPVASLGLWLAHEGTADEGTARMLMEEQIDFDVVGPGDDLTPFEAIVVPSKIGALESSQDAIAEYVAAGGKLLILGDGALNASRDALTVDVGATYLGAGSYDMDFTVVGAALAGNGLVPSPFLNYTAALRIGPTNADVLAHLREPYFSRTYGAYCGHQNTPNRLENAAHPAVIRHGNVIWLAHALDRMYYTQGAIVHRQLFANALRLLHAAPMAEADMPSCGRISLLHQPEHQRYVLHLLYASPLQRGRCLVIEDLPELHNVKVALRLPEEIKSLHLIPADGTLPMATTDGVLTTTIPSFSCHCAIVAEY